MNLLVSSVIRCSRESEPSGFVFGVNVDSGKVITRYPTPKPEFLRYNLNPRGGLRGSRGMTVSGNLIFIANASHVRVYNKAWELVDSISHPSCADIHDILARDEMLWVTSTRNGLCVEFDHKGKLCSYFDYRNHENVVAQLGLGDCRDGWLDKDAISDGVVDFRDPRTHQLDIFDKVHLNSLCFLPGGDMLVLFGFCNFEKISTIMKKIKGYLATAHIYPLIIKRDRILVKILGLEKHQQADLDLVFSQGRSAVIRVCADGACSVLFTHESVTIPNHSLRTLWDGSLLCCATNTGGIIRFDSDTGSILTRISIGNGFLRGIAELSANIVAVGCQNSLYLVDLEAKEVIERIILTEDSRVSIFDILVLTDDVAPLPEKLLV